MVHMHMDPRVGKGHHYSPKLGGLCKDLVHGSRLSKLNLNPDQMKTFVGMA